jgi:methionyl aminopeptidase
MSDSKIESYLRAGEVHKEACKIARDRVDEGVKHLEVAEDVESHIRENAGLAFPVNISVNEEAAHRTPNQSGDAVFQENDVICVDIGVHIDGFVADGAFTIDLSGEFSGLIGATTKALNTAVDTVESGVDVRHLGSVIEDILSDEGYNPIRNLQGHGVSKFDAHTSPSVPNVSGMPSYELEVGDVIAIEPFGCTVDEKVRRTSTANIFELKNNGTLRSRRARNIYDEVKNNYESFPFANRWLENSNRIGMQSLVKKDILEPHPVLAVNNGIVSQSEHTVVVEEDGCKKVTQHNI